MSEQIDWPRIRDLPKAEREPFDHWLYGQTRPLLPDAGSEDQDAYYPWDYRSWKAGWMRP